MKIYLYIFGSMLLAGLMLGCAGEPTLQQYYVDKQNDDAFISLDLPSSLIVSENNNLSESEKKTLAQIKKVNVLALQTADISEDVYKAEKEHVANLLLDSKYKTLMKYGSSDKGAKLLYTGDEEAIDELIVFASDDNRGFALLRVLGDDMQPMQMIKLVNDMDKRNYDFSILESFKEELE